ncbi:uncharacterized protein LOC129907325 [Episyrphus balteatus]|uniref:uncharacterized protein LOC129907325 n=1 Tax=Episyrphus balteatus TaxID=286459 RepID=UPI002485897D|nr:uncharacterized protein LOC129907325 [Episyrphus balteatus]
MNIQYKFIAIIAILSQFCSANKYNISLSNLETCNEYYLRDSEYCYADFFELSSLKQNSTKKDKELLHLKFYVNTSMDARIMLSDIDNPKSNRGYEIVIGDEQNSISWLGVSRAEVRVPIIVNSSNILSTEDPMPIEIIQTIDGDLSVNIIGYAEPLLKYKDTPPVNVKFLSFCTTGLNSAKWFYGCQFDEYSHVESQKMSENGVQTVESYVNHQKLSPQPKAIGATAEISQEDCFYKQSNCNENTNEKQFYSMLSAIDAKMTKLMDYFNTRAEPINSHNTFFNALVPTLDHFDDDQVMKFQIGVLVLMKKIKNTPTEEEPINDRLDVIFNAF